MMDLISSFMNKNLDDFVKSYAGSILPLTVTDHETSHNLSESESGSENEIEQTQQNKDINVIEHKEYSQTESPPHLLSSNSFTAKSIAESITSPKNKTVHVLHQPNECNESVDDNPDENLNDERNRKMYGEYGKTNFNLSVDILPMVSTQHTNNNSEADGQWTQLPNVVNSAKNNKKNEIKSLSVSANDSFLTNIAKEIELLDEELSSMGILTKANSDKEKPKTHSSDTYIQHDAEPKMDAAIDEKKDNEEEIVIIKDKLSILRKSLVFKKNTNEEVIFSNENEKNAYFDPLVSPMKKTTKMCGPEVDDYDEAIYHENATKIQKQWKTFQLKTLLINTFNRHLQQSKENGLPLTITDLMASTTHQIVEHAEKLFSAVHDSQNNNNHNNNINATIGHFSYGQLHFYGSPALDWSATYSMIESIVLRNLLYYKNSTMVKKIFDTQQILDDILSTQTDNKSLCSNVDNVLIDQLTTQLIQIKTELYKSCSNVDTQCNLNPLKLFPKNINIFRSKHSQSNSTKLSPDKSMEYDNNSTTTTTETTSTTTRQHDNSNTAKPEFAEIRSQLSLLRKSFSQRRRKVSKVRSSPKLSASLRSSIMRVNDEIDSLCITQQTEENQAIAQKPNDMYTNKPIFKFDIHTSSTKSFCMSQERPMTAPNRSVSRSHSSNNYRSELPEKKPYLKRKKLSSKAQKNIDWSHVKPRTVSRLSNNVRTARANNHRSHYKPNAINWKQRASSKVDCSWPTEKYRSTRKIKKQTERNKNKIIPKKAANEFIDTYHNNTYHSNAKRNHVDDDKYLYYLKKGNKIGKISRDSAEAQLHDGSGSMILQTKQEEDNNSNVQTVSSSDIDNEFQSENQLKELQQTFAAIEKAMKQRKQQQHL